MGAHPEATEIILTKTMEQNGTTDSDSSRKDAEVVSPPTPSRVGPLEAKLSPGKLN